MFKRAVIQIIILICVLCANSSFAAQKESSRKASLIIDLNNGKVLHANNPHALRYPASLVKMMTLYLTFKKINEGELSLDTKLLVSSKAASMPRLNMSLKAGSHVSVRKAILGVIVHSSNDAAVVLAEAIGGSETNFAKMMTEQARILKMYNSTFRNASGLPDKNQKSTAHDLALLSIALKRDFPSFFPWFSVTSFAYNGKTYNSHNRVLLNYKWATGLKTGFTNASGFNLTTTAHKDGRHLVGVVLGENTSAARDKLMMSLLDNHFNKAAHGIKEAPLANKATPKLRKKIINTEIIKVKAQPNKKINKNSTKIKKITAKPKKSLKLDKTKVRKS
ncbi:MAG: D-alanyl-D-alanine carboxypeptidase family protein [Rickettsiales bacterium]